MNEYEEELKGDNKKLGKLIIIMNLILIVPVMGVLIYNYTNRSYGDSDKAAKEVLSEIKAIENNEEKNQMVKDYDFVHQMSNNLIIAEDGKIRGNQDVTLENIEAGMEMLKNDSYIVDELSKWKDGNFENAVEVHNYCWRILGGEEGRAKEILKEGIDKAKKNIGKE